jgi:hypothetical protein
MLANTLFDMEAPPFDTFATLAVLTETLAMAIGWPFWGLKSPLDTQNIRK